MKLEKRCLRQYVNIPIPAEMKEGSGNCKICKYDPENNPKCRAYISGIFFEVSEKSCSG